MKATLVYITLPIATDTPVGVRRVGFAIMSGRKICNQSWFYHSNLDWQRPFNPFPEHILPLSCICFVQVYLQSLAWPDSDVCSLFSDIKMFYLKCIFVSFKIAVANIVKKKSLIFFFSQETCIALSQLFTLEKKISAKILLRFFAKKWGAKCRFCRFCRFKNVVCRLSFSMKLSCAQLFINKVFIILYYIYK